MPLDTLIELKQATIAQNDHLVLKEVDLEIAKNEFVYIIGRVGSGKTSLIRTLNAELPLRSGTGKVAGISLENLKRKQVPFLRRKIGVVFQDFQLLTDRTVYENLAFVLRSTGWKGKKEIGNRISEVLEKVELGYKGYKLPNQLSGGEQQRVVIARALLNNPELILADEPTGNLDPETSEGIMSVLQEIKNSGRAVLLATHNYTLLKKYPSRTLKCEKEKLLEVKQEEIDFESLKD